MHLSLLYTSGSNSIFLKKREQVNALRVYNKKALIQLFFYKKIIFMCKKLNIKHKNLFNISICNNYALYCEVEQSGSLLGS